MAPILDLPWHPVDAERFSARAAEVVLAAGLDATKQATAYSTRLVVREVGDAAGEAGALSWRLDVIEPARYGVQRGEGATGDPVAASGPLPGGAARR